MSNSGAMDALARAETIQQLTANARALMPGLQQLKHQQLWSLWRRAEPCFEQNPLDEALQPLLKYLTELGVGGPLHEPAEATAAALAQSWQQYKRVAAELLLKLPEVGAVEDNLLFRALNRRTYASAQFVLATDVDWYRGNSYRTSGAESFEDYSSFGAAREHRVGPVMVFEWSEKRVTRDEDGNFDKVYLDHWVGVYRVKGHLFRMLKTS